MNKIYRSILRRLSFALSFSECLVLGMPFKIFPRFPLSVNGIVDLLHNLTSRKRGKVAPIYVTNEEWYVNQSFMLTLLFVTKVTNSFTQRLNEGPI